MLWKCAGNGLLSVWIKLWESFFHTLHIKAQIFDLKHWQPQQNCWRRHSPIYKHGLSDWDVLLKGWSRVEECGWTGWGETSVSPVSKADSASSRYIQVTAVVLWHRSVYICGVGGGGVTLWLEFFECLAFMNQYRAPFKNNARLWREWRCDAGTVPLLYQRS